VPAGSSKGQAKAFVDTKIKMKNSAIQVPLDLKSSEILFNKKSM
jgi:hypothetical protein